MAYLGNTPSKELVMRLEARKSFSLGVWIKDTNGRPLDISNSSIRFVIKKLPLDLTDYTDADNLVVNSTAALVEAESGYARLDLQASDLDHTPGEYPFTLVLSDRGYSSVIARGIVDLIANTEFASVGEQYAGENPPTSLQIAMRGRLAVDVFTGPTLAPGTTSFTDADKAKLDGIEPGAEANVLANWEALPEEPGFIANKPTFGTAAFTDLDHIIPAGGSPRSVLTKRTATTGDFIWSQPESGGGGAGIDPSGVPAGYVPTASGVDTWDWEAQQSAVTAVNGESGDVVLTADDISDGVERVTMTLDERQKLLELNSPPKWGDIDGRPNLGSASGLNAEDVLQPGQVDGEDITTGTISKDRLPRMSEHDGVDFGTPSPTGGIDGDFYFQIT